MAANQRGSKERGQPSHDNESIGESEGLMAPGLPPPPSYDALFGGRRLEDSEPPPVPPRPSDENLARLHSVSEQESDQEIPEPHNDSVSNMSEATSSSVNSSEAAPQSWKRRPLSVEEEEIVENWRPTASHNTSISADSSSSRGASPSTPFLGERPTEMTSIQQGPHYTDIETGEIEITQPHLYEETSFTVPVTPGVIDKDDVKVDLDERVYATPESVVPDTEIVQPSSIQDVEGQVQPSSIQDVEGQGAKKRPLIFWLIVGVVIPIIAIGTVLILILVPMTFAYLDYYRVGLKEQRSTGEVDESRTYGSGRHGIGPDFKFRKFYATAYFESLEELKVFSSEKLEFTLYCSFQYFLKEDELGFLFEKYDNEFESIIYKVAYATIKNAGTQFSIDDFIEDRRNVEMGLHTALKLKLGGTCCPASPDECIEQGICDVCSTASDCSKGYHINVKYFQLGKIIFPENLMDRFLTQQLLFLHAEKEVFIQEYAITQKMTEALKEDILNKANEITANATAEADLIVASGEADAMAVVEKAHMNGLVTMYQSVGANTEEHKASINFLFTLDKHPNLYMGVGNERFMQSVRLNP